MKTLIVGCGYLGTALGQKLAALGDEVWGLRRDTVALEKMAGQGIQPIRADLLEPDSLKNLPKVDRVVLCHGLSKPSDSYEDTYDRATAHAVAALQRLGISKALLISSTSVYSTLDGSWVDEATDPVGAGYNSEETASHARALLKGEKAVLASGIPAMVFRLAGIYGRERNRLKSLREGRMKPVFSGVYMNRIRLEDIVSGILLLLEKGKPGEIYLGADDHPSTQKEFYEWLFEKMKLKIPETAAADAEKPAHSSNKRCSNQKIKNLGLVLKYPTFKEGYEELI